MSTSGLYTFNPNLSEHIDEGFERCGIDPAELKGRHVRSAIRSANLMLADWPTFGYKQFTLAQVSQALVDGTATITLPAGAYDIFHATLKRSGVESEMYPISRSDYNAIHDKTLEGRPDRYFVDKSTFVGSAPTTTVYLWQTPENSTDTMEIWYMRINEEAGDMQDEPDISIFFQEAFSAGLAFFLSKKYAPEKTRTLKADYVGEGFDEFKNSMPGGALGRALAHDRDTGDAVLRVQFGARGRR